MLAVWAAPRGIGQYIRQHFLDRTFQGLYHANAFDLGLLIPYFVVLVLLASYGLHRYILVYLYYKHRDNRTTEPAALFDDLPRVTVQLPIFNEQYVVERLLDAVSKLKYPREKLDIQVLDDSTDETMDVARNLVERYAALGNPITYHHRTNREGFKAGALAEGMNIAKGEFIAIFDRRLSVAHHSSLHRSENRYGADAVDAHQPELLFSHAGGSYSSRWPLRARALRTRPQRCVL